MRATLSALLISAALPTASLALCSGASIESYLDADVLAEVDRISDTTLNGKGLIWKAERDNEQITFFGSLHIYDPRLLPLRNEARAALETADLLLVEQTTEQLQEMQRELLADPSLILLPEGKTLIGMIDEATWELLAEAGRARGLPSPMTARFQPWYLVTALGTPPCAMPDIQAGLMGLDAMVMEDANAMGVETRALEDWRGSLRVLYEDPIEDQIDMLEMSILPPELEHALFASTFDAYFAGDVARVWELSRAALTLIPDTDLSHANEVFDDFADGLLDDRNQSWIDDLESAATEGPVVAVFGAAHLSGDNGVLNLMSQNGWQITRLDE
jgi:uncharacterized protein YbaP (TraB family)